MRNYARLPAVVCFAGKAPAHLGELHATTGIHQRFGRHGERAGVRRCPRRGCGAAARRERLVPGECAGRRRRWPRIRCPTSRQRAGSGIPRGAASRTPFVLFRRALDLPAAVRPRHRLDFGRQPLPARGQRRSRFNGARALRSALGWRPTRSIWRRPWRKGPNVIGADGPVLRPGRRHLASRQAGLSLPPGNRMRRRLAARPSSPTKPGRPTSHAPGRLANTNAGTCGRCRKSLTRACIPTAGPLATTRPTPTGSPPCRSSARPASRRSVPPFPTTCWTLLGSRRPARCGRAASRCCAKRSIRRGWPSPCSSRGSGPPRSTSSAARPTRLKPSARVRRKRRRRANGAWNWTARAPRR